MTIPPPDAPYLWYVAVGSNLGDRLENLRLARRRLRDRVEIVAASPLYESAPMYETDQPAFLNGLLLIRSYLEGYDQLALLREIEAKGGRVREATRRFGPRYLDLDIVAGIDARGRALRFDTDELTVPHPRMQEREFVLRPLADVDNGWTHPVLQQKVSELLATMDADSSLRVVVRDEDWQ